MVNKKNIILVFVAMVFCSSISTYAIDVIDMRSDSTIISHTTQKVELQLYTNYIENLNSQEFVKQISPYYKNILIEIDNYKMSIIIKNNKIQKIIEGTNGVSDLKIKLSKKDIVYLINNWKTMSSFDKIKYIISLDIPIGDVLRLSGIAMSLR